MKKIYDGKCLELENAIRKTFSEQLEPVATYNFTGAYSDNSHTASVCYINNKNVTLKMVSYFAKEELVISAFGTDQDIGEVEKIILEEENKVKEAKNRSIQ